MLTYRVAGSVVEDYDLPVRVSLAPDCFDSVAQQMQAVVRRYNDGKAHDSPSARCPRPGAPSRAGQSEKLLTLTSNSQSAARLTGPAACGQNGSGRPPCE